MDWLDRHLAIFPAPELMLVIGAGQGGDLPVLTRHAKTRLVLVEPQPDWAAFLRRQTVVTPQAEVLEYALDERSGSAMLKVFNFPELSSLRPDQGLASLLPGARQTAEFEVETRTLGDLTEQLDVKAGDNNWLVVDAPGVESSVLKGLADPELRRRYRHVVLRTSRPAEADGPDGSEDGFEAFLELGYFALGTEDLSDGDWPRRHLCDFGRSARHRELEGAVDALSRQVTDLKAAKRELEERLQRQQVEFGDRTSKLDEELRAARQDAEQRLSSLTLELEKSKQTLEEGRQLEERKLGELTAALESKEQELEQVRETHRRQREQMERELHQARSDLSVAVRAQAMRSADLEELQKRYTELLELKNRQNELLGKLGQRLGAASEYLHALNSPEASNENPEATDGLVRALAGDLDSSG